MTPLCLPRGSISHNPIFCWGLLRSVQRWQADRHTLAPSTSPLPWRGLARRRPSAPRPLRRRIRQTAGLRSRSCTRCADAHRSRIPQSVPTRTALARTSRLTLVGGSLGISVYLSRSSRFAIICRRARSFGRRARPLCQVLASRPRDHRLNRVDQLLSGAEELPPVPRKSAWRKTRLVFAAGVGIAGFAVLFGAMLAAERTQAISSGSYSHRRALAFT
jgi:hypothetical protein